MSVVVDSFRGKEKAMNFYKDFWANNGEKPYWVDDDRTFLEDYFSGELESSGLTTDQKRDVGLKRTDEKSGQDYGRVAGR